MDPDLAKYLTELVQKHDQKWKDRLAGSESKLAEARELLREALEACRMSNQLAGDAPLALFETSPLSRRIREFLGAPSPDEPT